MAVQLKVQVSIHQLIHISIYVIVHYNIIENCDDSSEVLSALRRGHSARCGWSLEPSPKSFRKFQYTCLEFQQKQFLNRLQSILFALVAYATMSDDLSSRPDDVTCVMLLGVHERIGDTFFKLPEISSISLKYTNKPRGTLLALCKVISDYIEQSISMKTVRHYRTIMRMYMQIHALNVQYV